jgi:pilus assembly protein CpaE
MLGSPKDARVIVLNKADAKVGLRPEDVVAAIKSDIAVNIPNSLTVPASINRGVPIVLDDPKGAVSASIRTLADVHLRSAEAVAADEPAQSPRKTLFRGRR